MCFYSTLIKWKDGSMMFQKKLKQFYLCLLIFSPILCLYLRKDCSAQKVDSTFFWNVQQKVKLSYDRIDSATFKAHSKTYIYFGFKPLNIKLIPLFEESFMDGIWRKPDSIQVEVKAFKTVRDTSGNERMKKMNIDSLVNIIYRIIPLPNPFAFSYTSTVLIDTAGNRSEREKAAQRRKEREPQQPKERDTRRSKDNQIEVIFPFAIGADSVYEYAVIGEVNTGTAEVLEVKVAPKKPIIPNITGIFRIEKKQQVIIGADFVYNDIPEINAGVSREKRSISIGVSMTGGRRIKMNKYLYDSQYWLPSHIEEEFYLTVLGMKFQIYREIDYDSYMVNENLVNSGLTIKKRIVYNRDPAMEKKLEFQSPYPNRLSKEEEERIMNKIEDTFSSMDLTKELFESEVLARSALLSGLGVRGERYFTYAKNINAISHYNRVEGARLKIGTSIQPPLLKNALISVEGGYGFSDKRWKGELAGLYHLDKKNRFFIEGNIYSTLGYEENRLSPLTSWNTFYALIMKRDYRDYYYKNGGTLGIGWRAADNLAFKVTGISETEESACTNVRFSVFHYNDAFRINPAIVNGELRALRTSMLYRTNRLNAELSGEYSDKTNFHSDFSYSRISSKIQWSFRPTFRTELTITGAGGTSTGELPPQKWFDFGGKIPMVYSGNLRGTGYKAFTGEKIGYGIAEYAINGSVISQRRLLKALMPRRSERYLTFCKFVLWYGAGWSELSAKNSAVASRLDIPAITSEKGYTEFGIGIVSPVNLFRFDFLHNSISKNAVVFSFNFMR